ncbi:MAG: CHASE2 domain-containing protein [Vicinamibacterales bacterium]
MRRPPRGARRRAGAAAALAGLAGLGAAAVTLLQPDWLVRLDRAAADAFVRQTAPPPASAALAVVAVDEPSLAALGQWPWPRDVVARLVTRLADGGASAIAFDILFPEADRVGQSTLGGPGGGTTDEALAAAFRAAPVVAGIALTFEPRAAGGPPCRVTAPPPVVRHAGGGVPLADLFQAPDAVCSLPVLARAAKATGTINASPDADGVLRRVPLLTRLDGQVLPGLALAAVLAAHPEPLVVAERPDGTLALELPHGPVVLDRQGQILLRPRGPGHTYPYASAAAFLGDGPPPIDVNGRIVFVGATALGVRDLAATPLDPRFPGVEVHAVVADTLLGGGSAAPPDAARALVVLGAAAGGTLAALAVLLLGVVPGVSLAAAGGAGVWMGLRAWFAASGALVSPAGPLLGLAAGAGAGVAGELAWARRRVQVERRRRQQAQRLTVQALTTLTETRDVDTGRHARRTQAYTRLLATTLARQPGFAPLLSAHRIDLLATLAPLHDIGKVGIPDAVLNKPGVLSPDERAEMQRHTTLGHQTLSKAEALAGVKDDDVLALAKDIVFTHHERWDGSGYPRGLMGPAIPLAGRIVAVVDTYDALVAERAYKKAVPHDGACAIIAAGRGTHFDPAVVDAFLECQADLRQVAIAEGLAVEAPTP